MCKFLIKIQLFITLVTYFQYRAPNAKINENIKCLEIGSSEVKLISDGDNFFIIYFNQLDCLFLIMKAIIAVTIMI